jgi:hypothetical protein
MFSSPEKKTLDLFQLTHTIFHWNVNTLVGSIYMPIVAFNADFSRNFQPNRHVKQEARLPAGYESVVLTSENNDDGTSVRE